MEKVIGFFGGDHQVGATMVAQSFAEVLQQRGKKVLYLMGSGKFGEEFLPLSGKHSIDDLKASVRSGRVTAEDFYQNLEQIRGLWVLPGVRNQLTAGYFTENTFEVLLSEVSEDFDYVVIDGGSDANLGITISALNTADHRFFVTTQQSKSIRRMILLQKNIVQPLERMWNMAGRQKWKTKVSCDTGDLQRGSKCWQTSLHRGAKRREDGKGIFFRRLFKQSAAKGGWSKGRAAGTVPSDLFYCGV